LLKFHLLLITTFNNSYGYYVVLALSKELFYCVTVCSLMRCVIGFTINEDIYIYLVAINSGYKVVE